MTQQQDIFQEDTLFHNHSLWDFLCIYSWKLFQQDNILIFIELRKQSDVGLCQDIVDPPRLKKWWMG